MADLYELFSRAAMRGRGGWFRHFEQVHDDAIAECSPAYRAWQRVLFGCHLPSNPVVASDFPLDALAPGTCTVTATSTFDPVPAACARPPIIQSAVFEVTGLAVPALDAGASLPAAPSIMFLATWMLRR